MPKIRAPELWFRKIDLSARLIVLSGENPFWKAEVLRELERRVFSGKALTVRRHDGDTLSWHEFVEELETPSLFAPELAVVIDQADGFVSRHQKDFVSLISSNSLSATLILLMKQVAANSRLARALADGGLWVDCSSAEPAELIQWLPVWAAAQYQVRLQPGAARLLVERIGEDPGLLAQEVAKLALYTDKTRTVTPELVTRYCATTRVESVWVILDLALEGRKAEALGELNRLLASGVHPLAILAQMAGSLRRLALAAEGWRARSSRASGNLRELLRAVGIPRGFHSKVENQLRRLGPADARRLASVLLEADLQLKGGSSLPENVVLERLILWLADGAVRKEAVAGQASLAEVLAVG